MLSSDILNPLLNNAYTRKITWLEASNRHALDEFTETLYNMRKRTQGSLDGMTDVQVTFASPAHEVDHLHQIVAMRRLACTEGA